MQQTLIQYFNPASKQSKVEQYIEEHQFLTNWQNIEHDGWRLPATDEPHYWCGIWKTEGCLNVAGHQKLGKGRRPYVLGRLEELLKLLADMDGSSST